MSQEPEYIETPYASKLHAARENYDILTTDVPDSVTVEEHVKIIAYNLLKASINEWKIGIEKQRKNTKSKGGTIMEIQGNVAAARDLVDMCLKILQVSKLNYDMEYGAKEIREQIDALREDVMQRKNTNPEVIKRYINELDKAERKVEAIVPTPPV